jgi:hypothetical protein
VHAYPQELAAVVWNTWRELERLSDPGPCSTRSGALPDQRELAVLLSVAYQASLLHEEDRPVRFRLFVGDPESLPEGDGPPEGLHRLKFTEPRVFDETEIRRLAPAAKYHRALIGVSRSSREGETFRIWGVIQSGPRWLESARGGRAPASPVPPDAIVVSVIEVGHVVVKVGDVKLGELRGGRIVGSALDVFDAAWMREQFDTYRRELLHEHEQAVGTRGVPIDFEGLRTVSQQMVKRLLATMRDAHHGGVLLYVPHEHVTEILRGAVSLKYPFADDGARRRYRSLMLGVMRELALAGMEMSPRPASVGYDAYQHSAREGIVALDEAIFEISQLLAGLADVDGAVVISDQLDVLGFGAEIKGPLPDVSTVRHAHDLEATSFDEVAIEGVGTRHRSAYRLCAFDPGCLAIVVSQDGGVQFVKSLRGAVTVWEHGQALI